MEHVRKAIKAVGSGRLLAEKIGVTPGAVAHWATGLKEVPAARCIAIEKACRAVVTRYDLRPDVFVDEVAMANMPSEKDGKTMEAETV